MESLRPSPDVEWIEVDGELIVRHGGTGDVHRLSSTAAILWPFFDGETTIDELADDVAAAFGIPHEQARSDIDSFAAEMQRWQLLVGDASEPCATPPDTGSRPQYLVTPPDP